jgi:hypothetical protein
MDKFKDSLLGIFFGFFMLEISIPDMVILVVLAFLLLVGMAILTIIKESKPTEEEKKHSELVERGKDHEDYLKRVYGITKEEANDRAVEFRKQERDE